MTPSHDRFSGRVAVVTGAASGIGAAVARRLACENATVVVSDIQVERVASLAHELRSQGRRALAVGCDVADEAAVQALVDTTIREYAGLHIVVNNAGIGEKPVPIDERSADDWRRVITTNLDSVFFGIKHAARVMKATRTPGVIINVASILGVVGFKGAPAYVAAKHGILGLTKAAALELAEVGIRVVAVNPAFIRTPLIAGMEDAVLPLHPIGRLGEADEVANIVAFLASDEARFLTGASYLVDGGYTAA